MNEQDQPYDSDAWLRLPWTEQTFKVRDTINYLNVAGLPFLAPATGEENDPRLIIIPGGWTHERCVICTRIISEEPEDLNIAFTNGEDWLCRECYEEHVLSSRAGA